MRTNNEISVRRASRADREMAKQGLVVTIGALVVTGFMKTKTGRLLHLVAGGALIGLSLWHHNLYGNGNGKNNGGDA